MRCQQADLAADCFEKPGTQPPGEHSQKGWGIVGILFSSYNILNCRSYIFNISDMASEKSCARKWSDKCAHPFTPDCDMRPCQVDACWTHCQLKMPRTVSGTRFGLQVPCRTPKEKAHSDPCCCTPTRTSVPSNQTHLKELKEHVCFREFIFIPWETNETSLHPLCVRTC